MMQRLSRHLRRVFGRPPLPIVATFAGGHPCCCSVTGSEGSTVVRRGSTSTAAKPAPVFDEACGGSCFGSPDTNLPASWQVTINGLHSGINCACDDLLGTYFCDWVGQVGAAPCVWRGPVPSGHCGFVTVEVQIFQSVQHVIRATLKPAPGAFDPPQAFFDARQSAPFSNCGAARTLPGFLNISSYCYTTGHTADIQPA